MICAELEDLQSQLTDIITALESSELTPEERRRLEQVYSSVSQAISSHQASGHQGGPCHEDPNCPGFVRQP